MNLKEKLPYALSIGVLLFGLTIFFFGLYEPKLLGVTLVLLSLIALYAIHVREKKDVIYGLKINSRRIFLGLLLIIVDISFNFLTKDPFSYFDYGMLSGGFLIILLNVGLSNFLRLDEESVSFLTFFIFACFTLYGFLFVGLEFILGDENFFLVYITKITVRMSGFFLNLIKPTQVISGTDINFDGFRIGVWIPCSGVESITVFLSAAISYFISTTKRNLRKMSIYTVIGVIALFFMNQIRIMTLVLVGYYFGYETMYFVHIHLGWVMFAVGMAVFWLLVLD